MSAGTVLIAAFSGRALAQSARRAGFDPLVVDCFGDQDTQAAAVASRCLPARVQVGFRARPLIEALDELAAGAATPPVGLVLGSGFECDPRMMSRLADRFRILGNPPAVVRAAKDPTAFFDLLASLGVRHPETRLTPPPAPPGWLMKRIGGSGGLHIHPCPPIPRLDRRRYFQKWQPGRSVSALGVVGRRGTALAFSRQWTSPMPRRPYRYGGAVSGLTLETELEARLTDACLAVARGLGLVGLVSFDFLIEDGEPLLIEVNPRPGATLDIFEDASGSLFAAHVAAAEGGDPADILASRWRPPKAAAAAILYADRGDLAIGPVTWPDWARDRPRPGTLLSRCQPVATVTAEGDTAEIAEQLVGRRLGLLADMLYENAHDKGADLP